MAQERPPLEEMTLRQLRKVASQLGVSRYSRMRKSQLLAAIIDAQSRNNSFGANHKMENQERVEFNKFEVGQEDRNEGPLSSIDEGLKDLPDGYGVSRIVLLPRDPEWAYTYWDVPNDHRQELRRQGGQQLALRIFDVTDINLELQSPHNIQEYPCDELAREWYLPIPVSDRDYVVEIGYRCADGRWLVLARSGIVHIPPVYPSDWVEDQFITVAWDENLRGKRFLELVPSSRTINFDDHGYVYDEIYNLSVEAENQRIAGSIFGSMQMVPGSGHMIAENMSSHVFASGVGMTASGSNLTTSGAGMTASGSNLTTSGVGMTASGAGLTTSGVGMTTSGVGLTTSGVGMTTSGAGLTTSGVGMTTSGVGLTTSGIGMTTSGVGLTTSGVGLTTSGVGMTASGAGLTTSGVGMTASGAGLTTSGVGMTTSGIGLTTSGIGMTTSGIGLTTSGIGLTTSGVGLTTSGIGYTTSGIGLTTSGVGLTTSGVGLTTSGIGLTTSGIGMTTSGIGYTTSGVGLTTSGIGYTTSGVGLTTSGIGYTTSGVGLTTSGIGYTTSGVGLTTSGIGYTTSGVGLTTSGIGMTTSGVGLTTSGIGYTTSGVGLTTSGIGYTTSGVGLTTSGIGYTTSGVGLTTSGIGYTTSGVGLTTSGIGYTTSGMGLTASGIGYTTSGMGMSGVGFGASQPPVRPRKFWLVADAELIIYGATEPDANVTIGGRPIKLNPDGTFRLQMSFQDGQLDFPIMAVAVDGEQTRYIHLKFNRQTPERHTNTKDEALLEWVNS